MNKYTKYIISQLTQITAWIGLFIILSVFFAPNWLTIAFGALLIGLDDKIVQDWCAKAAPSLTKKINEWEGK